MGLSEQQKHLLAKAQHARRLRLESGLSGGATPWSVNTMMDWHSPPEDRLEADDEKDSLLERLRRLDSRERTVLALRYGLGGEAPLSYNEIGRRLGVTREWVRKIAKQSTAKLVDSSDSASVIHH